MQSREPLPMKVVGRRRTAKVDVLAIDPMQRMANALREDRFSIPKGVWRFKTFEEADKWLIKMLATPRRHDSQP